MQVPPSSAVSATRSPAAPHSSTANSLGSCLVGQRIGKRCRARQVGHGHRGRLARSGGRRCGRRGRGVRAGRVVGRDPRVPSRSSALPGPGDVLAAAADVSGGLAGAGNTFLNGVGDQITGGTRLLNKELKGGAALAASGIVGGTGLHQRHRQRRPCGRQVVGGLADTVNESLRTIRVRARQPSRRSQPLRPTAREEDRSRPSAGDGSSANASKTTTDRTREAEFGSSFSPFVG